MLRLALIADDITGALDTGVQFSKRGAPVAVVLYEGLAAYRPGDADTVLVVDTESRHLPPAEAGERVAATIRRAVELGVTHFYKKTDSMLRGNISSELTAALEATGAHRLHFVPAYPDLGRTTESGIHKLDGIPIHRTAVAADPLDPVRCSDVGDIIGDKYPIHTIPVGGALPEGEPPAICVFDGATNDDLRDIGALLQKRGELTLTAGCAGFASVLIDALGLSGEEQPHPAHHKGNMLTVGGSVNALSLRQLDCAVRCGFARLAPSPALKLNPDADSGPFVREAAELLAAGRDLVIQSVTGPEDNEACDRYADAQGIPRSEIPRRIPQSLAGLVRGIMDAADIETVVIFGGDTAIALMGALRISCIIPEREPFRGVVQSRAIMPSGELTFITKSGGFGDEDVLTQLRRLLSAEK